jgi:hypothetical protein
MSVTIVCRWTTPLKNGAMQTVHNAPAGTVMHERLILVGLDL